MRNIWTIAKREYKLYFISPVAYVIAFMILLVLGIIFYVNIVSAVVQQQQGYPSIPDVQIFLNPFVTLLLFTTPAVTMRTLAEEQRMGTLELLLTSPVKDWELVVGKWLGSFLFIMSIVAVTLIYAFILNGLVSPGIDQGLLVSGYLGLALMISAFVAIGVVISSLFSNQIAAFFASVGVLLVFWLIGYPAQNSTGVGAQILQYLDLSMHYYNTFLQGIIQIQDIVYYLSMTALALFLGTVSVEIRRWR